MNKQIKPVHQKMTTYVHINLHVQRNKESQVWWQSQEITQSFHQPPAGQNKGCSGWRVCTIYPSGGQCLQADGAAEERSCSADLRKCLELSSGMRTGGRPTCKGCALVEDLLHQVAQIQEVVRRLHNIREVEMDTWFQLQSAVDPQPNNQQVL